jgi:hypothetical protein
VRVLIIRFEDRFSMPEYICGMFRLETFNLGRREEEGTELGVSNETRMPV